MSDNTERLTRPDGETLAYVRTPGQGPTVLWIGGYRSDMEGTKALALQAAAEERGWAYVRYDHFAHGRSSGDWRGASISRWVEDAAALVDHIVGSGGGPVLPVGSSMGGWVSLLLALVRPEAVSGLVLVNPAQDFSEDLMWPNLPDHHRQEIVRDGETLMPDEGTGAHVLTRAFFEDGRRNLLRDQPGDIACPVHILQGRRDDVVPWRHQLPLIERLKGDVRLELIAAGDHRLSSPDQLERLIAAVQDMR